MFSCTVKQALKLEKMEFFKSTKKTNLSGSTEARLHVHSCFTISWVIFFSLSLSLSLPLSLFLSIINSFIFSFLPSFLPFFLSFFLSFIHSFLLSFSYQSVISFSRIIICVFPFSIIHPFFLSFFTSFLLSVSLIRLFLCVFSFPIYSFIHFDPSLPPSFLFVSLL